MPDNDGTDSLTSDQRSEYDGGGVMPNTVYPKGQEALTASDKLRLQSITGQETDSRAPVDDYFWYGNIPPEKTVDPMVEVRRQNYRAERGRYKESPSQYQYPQY